MQNQFTENHAKTFLMSRCLTLDKNDVSCSTYDKKYAPNALFVGGNKNHCL